MTALRSGNEKVKDLPEEDFEQDDTTVNGASSDGDAREEKLKPGVDISVVSKWEAFFQGTEYMQKVREVADLYPEVRSVKIVYADLDRYDADLASYLLDHPDLCLLAGKQALRNLMHQEMRKADINLRIIELPKDSKVEIRSLRAKHVGKLVSVEGLVRKATEVRPKITDGLFQCLRCGHVIKEAQEGLFFKEPMECYKEQDGCGRSAGSTKFKLLTEESRFVDTQKVEVQESPEGLRGGAQPERLTGYLEDDAAGSVSPGDRVTLNGILRSVQKGQPAKSTLFDINLDIIAAESARHEYEDIEITPEDEAEIIQIAHSPDVFKKIIGSISPTIFGYDVEKESLALQLFGGVAKNLDDGTRIRGDIHILLIGDPGVAKCVTGDAEVTLADGSCRTIRDLVEEGLKNGKVEDVDDGVSAEVDLAVLTFSLRGRMEAGRAVRVWKRTAPQTLIKVTTVKGRSLIVTPTHPLFIQNGPRIRPMETHCITVGTPIAVSTGLFKQWNNTDFGWDMGFDWDKVASKEELAPSEPWVYDLEVDTSHNYVANGIVSHNSQMLRYMSRLAPRGIYASGKSSSAAGLCVGPETEILVDDSPICIGDFVEARMKVPVEARPGQWTEKVADQCAVTTMSDKCQTVKKVEAIWRIATPSFLVELEESGGKRLTLTPETKVIARPDGSSEGWVKASDIRVGQQILVYDNDSTSFQWNTVVKAGRKGSDLPPFVYDLTVADSHSFLANGFVVHNTAAAVKDDFGEGRWTLEAGALVLADRGQACLEENQPVLTNHGFKAIKDVRPGDQIVNYDHGYHCAKVKKLIKNGVKRTIKLHTYTGDIIECTPDHKVLTGRGWMEAGELRPKDTIKVPADYSLPTLIRTNSLEKGFVHGFALSDIYYNEVSPKNGLEFTVATKNQERARYVLDLLERHYSIKTVSESYRPPGRTFIRGKEVNWSENIHYQFSSATLKKEVSQLFHRDQVDLEDRDYCLGFLAGVLSTDCCVGHKQGTYGEKHVIDIGVGRRKYGPGWTERKQQLLIALFQSFGIMAVRRRRKVQILSLDSYNRAVELLGPFVVGKNKAKLYRVEARSRISSFDTLLDDDYIEWLASVKFRTSRTVALGLHSRIYRAIRNRKATTTLMETLRPHWNDITDTPFREPAKTYLLNPVIRITPGSERPVYDLTIDGEPNFLVSGGIVHNCIDEMDKMTDQDRSSMHEAMESQTISVAKAGITATLQCRCALLGAANPKYGRFQDHQYIAEQINMPPALLSRFDLIFAMTDKPSADRDAHITQHILKAHRRGQVRKYADPSTLAGGVDGDKILNDTTSMKPVLERDLLRKYVAYSKKIYPVLTDEAMRIISDFYLKIRKQGEGEGSSVPITARQLEAFVRISEASARAQLSPVVTADDAQRAVRIVEYYLRRIAGEGDKLDFDIIATGTSHSQREQIGIIKKLIAQLSKEADAKKGVSAEEIFKSGLAEGITEDRAKTLLKRLAQNGEIYSPSSGHYKLASEG